MIANCPVEEFTTWAAQDRAAFEGWRSGKPLTVPQTNDPPVVSVP